MNARTLGIVMLAGLLLGGCSGTRSSAQQHGVLDLSGQLAQLDMRLAALEQRQGLIEGKTWDQRGDVAYLRGRMDAVGGGVSAAGSGLNEKPTARRIQAALKQAGFYGGSVDGKIGPRTKDAIKDFQQANGLKVDGKVGPQTWMQLSRYVP